MLPEEIRNDCTKHEYRVLPMGETDIRNVVELWQRKSTEQDILPTADETGMLHGPCQYFGEWVDVTEKAKLQWECIKAQQELNKLLKQQEKGYRIK